MYSAVCRLNRSLDNDNELLRLDFIQFQSSTVFPWSLIERTRQLRRDMEIARDWLYELENE
jgi:hypothetical protein